LGGLELCLRGLSLHGDGTVNQAKELVTVRVGNAPDQSLRLYCR